MIRDGKRNVLGVLVDVTDYESAVDSIIKAARSKEPLAVTALAVHGLMTGVLDDEQRFRLNVLDLVVPDGQPVRWALNWMHRANLKDRVYGPTLTLEVCKRAEQAGLSVFLFGGTEEILLRLQQNLRELFPRLRVVGAKGSKFRRLTVLERDHVVSEIRNSGASIVFVGLGCPRQEIWVYEFRELLNCPLLAVGAAFPKEPIRLWKRYALLNPQFLALLILQRLGIAHFPDRGRLPNKPVLPG